MTSRLVPTRHCLGVIAVTIQKPMLSSDGIPQVRYVGLQITHLWLLKPRASMLPSRSMIPSTLTFLQTTRFHESVSSSQSPNPARDSARASHSEHSEHTNTLSERETWSSRSQTGTVGAGIAMNSTSTKKLGILEGKHERLNRSSALPKHHKVQRIPEHVCLAVLTR